MHKKLDIFVSIGSGLQSAKTLLCLVFFIFFACTILFSPSQLNAGLYHASAEESAGAGDTLACAQCHTMHGSEGGSSGSMMYDVATALGAYPKLLRASTTNALCKYCHETSRGVGGGKTSPVIFNVSAYVPSAGDFKHGGTAYNPNRHDMDRTGMSTVYPPGYTGVAGDWTNVVTRGGSTFTCIYCHDQHGNTNYRNLRYDPGNVANDTSTSANRVDVSFAYNSAADPNDATKSVNNWGGDASTPASTKYRRDRIRFRRAPLDADAPLQGVSAWCGKCHGKFYGISGGADTGGATGGNPGAGDNNTIAGGAYTSPWTRHPVQDINITTASTSGHADLTAWGAVAAAVRMRVVDPDGTVGNGDDQPLCLSCHYAHGGGNADVTAVGGDATYAHSMLVYVDAANKLNIESGYQPPSTEATVGAGGRMRRVCQQCHNQ